jgi:uncharacterized protein (DUF58 family)
LKKIDTHRPVIEGLTLFVGGGLAIAFPVIIVPTVLLIALAGFFLERIHRVNPATPTLSDLLAQRKVVVTTRVVLLLLFGTLPLMIAKEHLWAIAVCIIYNLVIFSMVVADVILSPHPDKLSIERKIAGKLSIGRENLVELIVTNHSHSQLEIELLDEFPKEFRGEGKTLNLKIDKRSSATFSYRVVPLSRGCFYFNRTVVRYRGLLELVVFQKYYGEPYKVEVYPDIGSIARFDLMMRRTHLIESGLISERRRGSGTDFESLREYVRGDEFRKIDWKASARRNKLITREFQSEVNQSILIMLDCSRSMGAKVKEITLLDHAANGALLLGHQVLKKGDKVGLVTFSDSPHQILLPARGKNHFFSFVRQLYAVEANRVEPDFKTVFKALNMTRVRRSLLMIITDLIPGEAVKKMQKAIPLVARKHLPVVISVLDPNVKVAAEQIPETEEEVFQKVVATNLIRRISKLAKQVELVGAATLVVTPEQLSSSMLSQYLKAKLRSRL